MDVLLVEDEPLAREAVAEALGEAGLDVAQAGSAEGALAAVGLAADAAASAAAVPRRGGRRRRPTSRHRPLRLLRRRRPCW
jgi:DNA-binding response OmpR family regulator